MTRFRLLVPLVGLLTLLATACGGGDSGAEVSDPLPTADGAPPAAGACLEGAEDCQDTGGDMGAPGPDTPVTAPQEPIVDGDQPVGQATEVAPQDGLDNVHPVGWDKVDVDPDDQTRVTVSWWSGVEPCHALAGVDVESGDEALVLTVMEGNVPADEPQACIEIAVYKQTTITLDEPVGPRSIIDGADA